MTYLKTGEYAAARKILLETVADHPDSSPARYWLGVSLYELNEDTEAIEQLTAAIVLNPDYPAAYDYLGRLYDRRGETARALDIYSRGVEINPDSLVLNYNLGMLAWREGMPVLAEKYLLRSRVLTDDERMKGIVSSALEKLRSGAGP